MKFLVILAVTIAYAAAGCTDVKRLKVKQQWASLYSQEGERIVFNTAVWKSFFMAKPEARSLFDRVNGKNIYSPEFRAHMFRVNSGLDMCLSLLDEPETLAAQTAHLKKQHTELPGSGDYINDFNEALMGVVAAEDIKCFDYDAWSSCLSEIATAIFG